ncbi:type II toxin-antitoxin system VapC family toxin [Nocardia sp. NPDC055053]
MTEAVTAPRRATLVDTCVLIDVLDGDPTWEQWSASALSTARNAGRVVINPLIYAEVSIGYATKESLESALQWARSIASRCRGMRGSWQPRRFLPTGAAVATNAHRYRTFTSARTLRSAGTDC